MADRADEHPSTEEQAERLAPPRFGRNVKRPRVIHARGLVEQGDDVLAEIDRLIAVA